MSDEELLDGGSTHVGQVVRIGDTVRRPRTAGAELAEAFLAHTSSGLDSSTLPACAELMTSAGRFSRTSTATPLPNRRGSATMRPIAPTWFRSFDCYVLLHTAGDGFVPPHGSAPRRDCPVPGTTWLHGDVHYGNLVFRGEDPVALLDWDFVMPGDALYDVVTLLFSARNPRPELPDEFEDRAVSARHTLAALLDGYGADDAQRRRATSVAAAMCRGAAEFDEELARRRFLADWWPQQSVS